MFRGSAGLNKSDRIHLKKVNLRIKVILFFFITYFVEKKDLVPSIEMMWGREVTAFFILRVTFRETFQNLKLLFPPKKKKKSLLRVLCSAGNEW